MTPCPCCGAPTNGNPLDEVIRTVPPTAAAILRRLADEPGEVVTHDDLHWSIWRGRDEPDHPRKNVCISLKRARDRVQAAGWAVRPVHGRGYRLVMEVAE